MEKEYTTIAKEAHIEFEEKHSRFIGHACPCVSEEEALAFISRIKAQYPDATHNVYAYFLREMSATRYSDDREPQGTAGLPVLDSIRKRGLTDAAVVVTRYFGGTLLGTGGLVRAYTKAAVDALDAAGRKTFERLTSFVLKCDYASYQKIQSVLACPDVSVLDSAFGSDVTIELIARASFAPLLESRLSDVTCGRISVKHGGEIYGSI